MRFSRIGQIALGFAFVVIFQSLACTDKSETETLQFGPNSKTDLVFFFKIGTAKKDIEKFLLYDGLVIPAENGTGHYLPDGMGTGFGLAHKGFEGYGLNYKLQATNEQKIAIKRRVEEPHLYFGFMKMRSPPKLTICNFYPTSFWRTRATGHNSQI